MKKDYKPKNSRKKQDKINLPKNNDQNNKEVIKSVRGRPVNGGSSVKRSREKEVPSVKLSRVDDKPVE
ncbi:hypothetical protein, partial [Paenibacillus silvae]